MPGGRSKYWCWTDFAVGQGHPPIDASRCDYAIWQREKAPSTEAEHFQGYIALRTATGLKGVQTVLGRRMHCAIAKGTVEQCIAYCSKEETRVDGPWEYGDQQQFLAELGGGGLGPSNRGGVAGHQGKRTDIAMWAERCKHRGGLRSCADDSPGTFVKYYRGFERIRLEYISSRSPSDAPDVRVYHGNSGSGKTRSVYDCWDINEIYQKDGSKWWNGYDGQQVILLDDWAGSDEIPPVELLKILDRYPHRVQTKGGYVVLAKAIIVITTMIHWSMWYNCSSAWMQQIVPFERRVTSFVQYPRIPLEEVREEWPADAGDDAGTEGAAEPVGDSIARSMSQLYANAEYIDADANV